jgi:SNF2 family DNA or RNA helicase
MDVEHGSDEAAYMPADAVGPVSTHTHGTIADDNSPRLTSTAPPSPKSPIMDSTFSLSVPSSTDFQMNHSDGDSAASHADNPETTPRPPSVTDESSFVGMKSATDRLPAKQTQSNRNARPQNDKISDINSSTSLPDGKDKHHPSRASRSRRSSKTKLKPAESRKKSQRGQEKRLKQEGCEEREERFRDLRKELADDGETGQGKDDEEQLEDMTEDLKIFEGDLSKLNRTMKKRPLSVDELRQMDELRGSITRLRKEIHDLEISKKSAPKATRAKTAREFWERSYAAGSKENLVLVSKIAGNKRKRGNTEAHPGGKKHRGVSKTVCWGKNSARDPDDVQDPRQALAESLGIQGQEEITLENKTKLFQQLTSKKTRGPGADPRAKDQLQVLKHATSSFGFKGCSLEKEKSKAALNLMRWQINSFKSQLYNHQVVGVSWMLRREFSPQLPYGGILGDTMGLGKTVQILACMAHNPPLLQEYPTDHPYKTKATLIIAPACALNQWKNEILIHTYFKPAYIYKKTGSADKSLWMTTDIVYVTSHSCRRCSLGR